MFFDDTQPVDEIAPDITMVRLVIALSPSHVIDSPVLKSTSSQVNTELSTNTSYYGKFLEKEPGVFFFVYSSLKSFMKNVIQFATSMAPDLSGDENVHSTPDSIDSMAVNWQPFAPG